MEQRLTLVTLGVTDLDAARRFYLEGLGWQPLLDAGEAVFLQVGPGLVLSLYGRADLAGEAGTAAGPVEPPPFSLAHNVDSPEAVASVVADLRAAGGTVVSEPARASWGGVTAYVADPDGFRWEIAWNPGLTVADDGSVRMGGAEADQGRPADLGSPDPGPAAQQQAAAASARSSSLPQQAGSPAASEENVGLSASTV